MFMHPRQTRSSLVAVSRAQLPDCQNRNVSRGTARVPTNQMRAVPAARVRTHFLFLLPKFEIDRGNGRMPTNQKRADLRALRNGADACT